MTTETHEIEVVLRRILNDGGHNYLTDMPPPAAVFRPSEHDVDGISVSLKSLRTPTEEGESGRNPRGYFVAEIAEKAIQDLGLSIEKKPVPGNDAHCVIPELCTAAKKANKLWVFEVTTRLAESVKTVTGPFIGQNSANPGA